MKIGLDVTVLHDYQKTGVGVYTYQLLEALFEIDSKNQYKLFGVGNLESFQHLKELDFLKKKNAEPFLYKIPSKFFRSAFLLWQSLNFPSVNQFIGEVDVFHSFNYYLPPQSKGKVVATVYDMTPVTEPSWHHPRTVEMERVRLNRINKYADLVVAISEQTKKDFLKLYPNKRVEVIYPGVGKHFLKRPTIEQIKKTLEKYHLQPGYFLSVATLEPRKNLQRLIEAYLKGGFAEKLVLVGKIGWGESHLHNLIKANQDKIIALGYVSDEDLPVIYSQALCLVYPSLYEGFGIPPLEAMYCNVAVITSDISSLPEVTGEAALYINPQSVDELLGKMKLVQKSKALREKLVQKGILQSKKFSWQKSAQKLLELYYEFS